MTVGAISHTTYSITPPGRIQTAGAVLSIFTSAVLLVGAIVCLLLIANYSIHLRVGMIVLFTFLFALVVGLFTNARRAEIFGATAAQVIGLGRDHCLLSAEGELQ